MKRLSILLIAIFLPFLANAQYRISSVDKQDSPYIKLLWAQELEDATLIYGCFEHTSSDNDVRRFYIGRTTAAWVNGEKYKITESVNFPIKDEADMRYLRLGKEAGKVNFLMRFEKFSLADGFDIIEDDNKHTDTMLNYYGIHLEKVEPEAFVKAERFLDSHPATIEGRYAENGDNYTYLIRDNVCVTCTGTNTDGDVRYYVEIVNNSDHGIKLDWDKVWVATKKVKKNGTVEWGYAKKYSPESYESYLQGLDYNEARYAVGSSMDKLSWQLNKESWYTDSEWGKLGLKTLSDIAKKAQENSIQEYLNSHPKNRPGVLRSQSIRAGESYHGYMAHKKVKVDVMYLHIVMDDYDFCFDWQ